MGKEEALDILLDTAENGSVDVEEIKFVFAEMKDETILDKIRAEIADLADAYGDYQMGFNFGLMRAAQIIDKYKAGRADE